MKKRAVIEIFYFDAGSGHRSAMRAIKEILIARHPGWIVSPVDLQKVLEPVDPFHKISAKLSPSLNKLLGKNERGQALPPLRAQEFYNFVMNNGAARSFTKVLPLVQEGIRKRFPQMELLLKRRWQASAVKPDLVLSVIPNFNGVLFRALHAVHGGVPFITVMTDWMDRAPNFWMENQDQILICGSELAAAQARASGYYAPTNIYSVSGMVLNPAFYKPRSNRLTLDQLGLSRGRPTALVFFGGNGSMAAKMIVDRLERSGINLQCIVLCGHNARLLEKLGKRNRCHAVGFVSNVIDYMALADFMIGKPGPGCLSEALHMGLPVIVERNASTIPQEKPNADWLQEKGVGIVLAKFGPHIASAAAHMIMHLDLYKQNIRLNIRPNRALFEVADIIDGVLLAAAQVEPNSDLLPALPQPQSASCSDSNGLAGTR